MNRWECAALVLVFAVFMGFAGVLIWTAHTVKPKQKQPAVSVGVEDGSSKLRIDPLGKFTSPGRCVGMVCF